MLEPDVREENDPRPEHVRRVVAPAQPGLHDGDVDARGGKCGERCGRHDLELGRGEALRLRPHAHHGLVEVCFPSIDADPLAPARDVGRDRGTDREPLGEEQLLDRHRRGRLAVRSDDVDRGIRVLRITERVEEHAHAVEPEAVPRPRAHRIEPLDCAHRRIVGASER